jgi:hypothetical protein
MVMTNIHIAPSWRTGPFLDMRVRGGMIRSRPAGAFRRVREALPTREILSRRASPMKRLSFLLVLALAACGAAEPAAPAAGADQPGSGAVQPAADSGKFYREGLSGVDFSGLDAVAKERALKLLNGNPCDCGCGMNIAQCRVDDATCPRSPVLAAAITNALRAGATDQQALVALKAVRDKAQDTGQGAATAARAVPAVNIDVDASPSLGPEDAVVTLVAWEDFQ